MPSNTQKVAYNTFIQVGARLITSIIGLVSLTLTTRSLGIDLYGQLTAASVYVGLISTVTDIGLGTIVVREIVQKVRPVEEILGTSLILRSLVSLTATTVGVLGGLLIYHGANRVGTRQAILFLGLTILLATLQSSITAGLVAFLRNDLIVIGDILGKALTLGLIYWAVMHKTGFNGILLAYVLGALLNFLSDMIFGLWKFRPKFSIDLRYWKHIVKLALPIGAAGVLSSLYFNADGFLLSLMRPNAEVGLYGVAYKIVQVTMAVPVFFVASTFPIIAASYKDLHRVSVINLKSLRAMGTLAAPALFGVLVLSPELTHLFGGQAFEGAAVPMTILMFSNYFTYLNVVYGNTLLAINAQRRIFQLMLITLVVNIGLNLITIPLLGITGAAIALVVTEIVAVLILRHFHKLAGIQRPPWSELIPGLLCGAFMGAMVWLAKPHLRVWVHNSNALTLIACAILGGAIYLLVGLATKTIKISEILQLVRPSEDV